MTTKEKAIELVDKFKPYSHFWVNDFGTQKEYDLERLENAKDCALIAVNEVIKESADNEYAEDYWIEVKQEIERLC